MALNDRRNEMVTYVAALARDRLDDLLALRLDNELFAAAYCYLDPSLPCFIRSAQVRDGERVRTIRPAGNGKSPLIVKKRELTHRWRRVNDK